MKTAWIINVWFVIWNVFNECCQTFETKMLIKNIVPMNYPFFFLITISITYIGRLYNVVIHNISLITTKCIIKIGVKIFKFRQISIATSKLKFQLTINWNFTFFTIYINCMSQFFLIILYYSLYLIFSFSVLKSKLNIFLISERIDVFLMNVFEIWNYSIFIIVFITLIEQK